MTERPVIHMSLCCISSAGPTECPRHRWKMTPGTACTICRSEAIAAVAKAHPDASRDDVETFVDEGIQMDLMEQHLEEMKEAFSELLCGQPLHEETVH